MRKLNDETIAALEHVFGQYIEQFNKDNAAAIQELFDFPMAMVGGPDVLLVADKKAGTVLYQSIIDDLKAKNWARSKMDKIECIPIGTNGALLQVDYSRYLTDGSEMARGRAYYAANRDTGTWRISTVYHN